MPENGHFDLSDINARLSVLENELKNHSERAATNQGAIMNMLAELKQGLGLRVEQHGESIAVLKNSMTDNMKRVDDLEKARTWVIMSIVGAFIASVWALIVGHKQ